MDANKLLSADGIEERAEYYSKWGADIRAMNGASVDADHAEQTAFVLRALLANAQAQAASISALTKQVEARDEALAVMKERCERECLAARERKDESAGFLFEGGHMACEAIEAEISMRLSSVRDAENSGS